MNAPESLFPLDALIREHADRLERQVIEWRRQIHANPELGNREFETAKLVAAHMFAVNGWLGPPWLKAGWFHAYLLLAPAAEAGARTGRRSACPRQDGSAQPGGPSTVRARRRCRGALRPPPARRQRRECSVRGAPLL